MANTSVSGLVSGLDTATIISQLMQIEAQPQTNLKNRVTTEQKVVTALQAMNTKLAGIATKAGDLAKLSSWSRNAATSSNDEVTVTADATAVSGSLSFSVQQLATSASTTYATAAATDTVVVTPGISLTISFADTTKSPVTISDTGDGKLSTLVSKLNAAGTGVDAVLVRANTSGTTPTYQLSVTSEGSGADSGFTISTSDGSQFMGGAVGGVAGVNAQIKLAGETAVREYASNTITDLMAGVDVTLQPGSVDTSPTPTLTTITVSRDAKGMSDSVKAMVDAVNSVLDDINKQTAYDSATKTSGLLSGEASLRAIRDQLLFSVTNGVGGKSLADVGVQVDRNGMVVFDEARFQAAYSADPAGVATKFAGTATYTGSGSVTLQGATWRTQAGTYNVSETNGTLGTDTSGVPIAATRSGSILTGATKTPVDGLSVTCSAGAVGTITYQRGFASALEAVTQIASNSTNGTLTSSIQNRNDGIKRMNDDIDDWDVRLQVKQQSLQRQYAALEVALGKLQDQASWLSGQISSLPKMSS